MTGHPPDDGSFPGNPGGPPFPGRPGPPPQPGHGGGQPRFQPPPADPFPGQPGGYTPGYGAPGGVPPQRPPVPGYPVPGGPPTRTGRVALVVGSAVAAVALLVTGGVVVWNLSGARPYAELPSCRRLLPGELLDAVPGAEGLRAEGEYREADEITDFDPDPALLGYLTCSVFDEDQSASVLWVTVDHYEYDDEGAAAEDLRDDHEDRLADVEDGDWADEWGLEVIDWAPLSTGDGGVAMAVEGGYLDEGGSHGTAYFHAANLGVSLNHSAPRDLEGEEVLAAVDDLAGRIHRQLSREGERA